MPVTVINERVQYMDADGKLVTESLTDYTKKNILSEYASLNDSSPHGRVATAKKLLLKSLNRAASFLMHLQKRSGAISTHLTLYATSPMGANRSRDKRGRRRRRKPHTLKNTKVKRAKSLMRLLEKYADQGITAIDDIGDLVVSPFTEFGTPLQIVELSWRTGEISVCTQEYSRLAVRRVIVSTYVPTSCRQKYSEHYAQRCGR